MITAPGSLEKALLENDPRTRNVIPPTDDDNAVPVMS
jgi:hypothetical protein